MTAEYNILIADDHSVVRQGVSLILKYSLPDISIVQTDTLNGILEKVAVTAFDLIILDINLPGGNNVSMIEKIRTISPEVKILMFSAFEEEVYAMRYLNSGANGYLNKLGNEDEVVEAVKKVLTTGKYISDNLKDKLINDLLNNVSQASPLERLSNRELEISRLLVNGYGSLEIANHLNIQMSTVSTYKSRIFEKLDIKSVVSLVDLFKLYEENS
ncbi:response regulator transcription factor [Flavobacterium cerinum]|uniref:Response regulator transcription factor n=1 Tax=Flavobacterium cerinum TaxID=2502784 RepID=A0ABY5IM00_9FLAO|nr:response regulator transcription factor [Flavobacterium cerinum]UUC43861.1 response regulator transcription factor [Flavobacterium cerinum]